ncbi:hypothetical protein Sjap_006311 [Stephania japonica]|uniref:PPM-type phosphatase domain-containing protein n=1 Tax=Stephania japonica TaxID=461633 RepID=A0AAP0PIS5_9MAGN
MGLKDFYRKFKAFRGTKSIAKVGESSEKKALWTTSILHGFHVVEDCSELVVAQREHVQDQLEMWFFGVFDAQVGDKITKYLQSHLFANSLSKNNVGRKCKEAMKKAYMWARSKILNEENKRVDMMEGSASVIVINGKKIVAANMGNYRVVVSREGIANEICEKYGRKRRWSLNLISGSLLMRRRGYTCSKLSRSPRKLAVGAERIGSETEFVILASNGVWEVMNNQEAVDLIWHIDDPKIAAECLAREALARMSRGHISCLVIRFN